MEGDRTHTKEHIKAFFAVTETSVYLARIGTDNPKEAVPALVKIAVRGDSAVPVGKTISNGTMIAVCRGLVVFMPEGSGRQSPASTYEREIARVNILYHGGGTSLIVALFLNETDALACSGMPNLQPCDPRWKEKTIATLKAIGENHPYCSISTWPDLWLIPPSEWMDIANAKKQ